MSDRNVDIAVIGAGIVGIACAYYLARSNPATRIAIVDPNAPMSLTSAASGENYRNWWPHPVMTAFTDYSIDLLEEFARQHDNPPAAGGRGLIPSVRGPGFGDRSVRIRSGCWLRGSRAQIGGWCAMRVHRVFLPLVLSGLAVLGLSFAAMAELVISVACLGNNLEETVILLRGLDDHQPNSKEFDRPGAMGFGTAGPRPKRRDMDIPF